METSAINPPCQECGRPHHVCTFYIEGRRLCSACYSALLAKKNLKDAYQHIQVHRKSLDKLSEL